MGHFAVLRNRFLIRDGLVAPFRNRGHNMAGPMVGKSFPNDFLRLGREITGHEFQRVVRVGFELFGQLGGGSSSWPQTGGQALAMKGLR